MGAFLSALLRGPRTALISYVQADGQIRLTYVLERDVTRALRLGWVVVARDRDILNDLTWRSSNAT